MVSRETNCPDSTSQLKCFIIIDQTTKIKLINSVERQLVSFFGFFSPILFYKLSVNSIGHLLLSSCSCPYLKHTIFEFLAIPRVIP